MRTALVVLILVFAVGVAAAIELAHPATTRVAPSPFGATTAVHVARARVIETDVEPAGRGRLVRVACSGTDARRCYVAVR